MSTHRQHLHVGLQGADWPTFSVSDRRFFSEAASASAAALALSDAAFASSADLRSVSALEAAACASAFRVQVALVQERWMRSRTSKHSQLCS